MCECRKCGTKAVGIMNSKMDHATKAGSGLIQLQTKGAHLKMMLNQCIILWRKGKSAESHQHGVIEAQGISDIFPDMRIFQDFGTRGFSTRP